MAPDGKNDEPAEDARVGNITGPRVDDLEGETPPDDSFYDPSDSAATRAREQGRGVGARDLARQRDPSRPAPAEDEGDDE